MMQVREVELRDLNPLDDLFLRISNFNSSGQSVEARWAKYAAQKQVTAYVLHKEDEILGYVELSVLTTLRGSPIGSIQNLVVKSGFERQGFGGLLVNHARIAAQRAGCYKVVVECRDELVPFYLSQGFQANGFSLSHRFADQSQRVAAQEN